MVGQHSEDRAHTDLDKQRLRADLVTRVVIVLVVLFLAATLVLLAVVTQQARNQAISNGQLSGRVLQTQELLIDCTTPGGQCYQDGQKRTAEAVQGINQGNLIAVAAVLDCRGHGHETAPQILDCAEKLVARLMAERRR